MLTKIKGFLWKIVSSSQDPKSVGLTVKSIIGLLVALGYVEQATADTLVEEIIKGIVALFSLVASMGVIYGAVRKVKPKK